MNNSFGRFFNIAFKIILAVCIGLLLYKQLYADSNGSQIYQLFRDDSLGLKYEFLLICFLLMPVNWLLEAWKWKRSVSVFEKLSLRRALYSVLSGLSLGIVTPARIGEYGGRMLHLHPDHKIQALGATFLGSLAQNIVNVAVGLPFSYYFLKNFFDVTYQWTYTFVLSVSIGIVFVLYLFFNISRVGKFLHLIPWIKKRKDLIQKLETVNRYNKRLLTEILVISIIRYLIYFFQYICLFWFLAVQTPILTLLGGTTTIYIVQSGMPLPLILGLMARGELAILVWSSVGVESIKALSVTILLWMINLMLPGLAGLVIIMKLNLKKYFK